MHGEHTIKVENNFVRYDFTIRRNITVVRGDSATGKTQLINMLLEYGDGSGDSGVSLVCDKPCYVLTDDRNWQLILEHTQDTIIFIDEEHDFITTEAFASAVKNSDNYYVLGTRNRLPMLPYSVEEIYGIHVSGKYKSLRQTYNEFYRIYGQTTPDVQIRPQRLITEDSNSGYDFFHAVAQPMQIPCSAAGGSSQIFTALKNLPDDACTLIVADGAAFGPEMERVDKELRLHPQTYLYLPESFEWLILQSGLFNAKDLRTILAHPADYVESAEFFSWERFFTAKLIDITRGTYLQYQKKQLNRAYLTERAVNKIKAVMEHIQIG